MGGVDGNWEDDDCCCGWAPVETVWLNAEPDGTCALKEDNRPALDFLRIVGRESSPFGGCWSWPSWPFCIFNLKTDSLGLAEYRQEPSAHWLFDRAVIWLIVTNTSIDKKHPVGHDINPCFATSHLVVVLLSKHEPSRYRKTIRPVLLPGLRHRSEYSRCTLCKSFDCKPSTIPLIVFLFQARPFHDDLGRVAISWSPQYFRKIDSELTFVTKVWLATDLATIVPSISKDST